MVDDWMYTCTCTCICTIIYFSFNVDNRKAYSVFFGKSVFFMPYSGFVL